MKWIMVHGYDFSRENWKDVMWGKDVRKGRLERAIEEGKRNNIKNIIIGSCTFGNKEKNQKIQQAIKIKLYSVFHTIVTDNMSKTTIEEVFFLTNFLKKNDTLYLVSDYIHLPRCLKIAEKILKGIKIIGFPSDIPYKNQEECCDDSIS